MFAVANTEQREHTAAATLLSRIIVTLLSLIIVTLLSLIVVSMRICTLSVLSCLSISCCRRHYGTPSKCSIVTLV